MLKVSAALPRSLRMFARAEKRAVPAFTCSSASRVRARRHRAVPADRPAGAPMRLTRSSRRCGCWPTSTRRISFSRNSFSRSRLGANDGARAVSGDGEVADDAEVDGAVSVLAWSGRRGGERRELRGHRQSAAKFSSTVTSELASSSLTIPTPYVLTSGLEQVAAFPFLFATHVAFPTLPLRKSDQLLVE